MGLISPKIVDDRGRPTELAGLGAQMSRDEYGRVRRTAVTILIVLLGVVSIGAMAVIWLGAANRGEAIVRVAAMACVIAAMCSWRITQRQRARALVSQLTRELKCPACCFDLARLPASADGCTQCPECGAAWRLPYARW